MQVEKSHARGSHQCPAFDQDLLGSRPTTERILDFNSLADERRVLSLIVITYLGLANDKRIASVQTTAPLPITAWLCLANVVIGGGRH